MELTRRNFLQQAGFALFALGGSEGARSQWDAPNRAASPGDRYLQALAQPPGRKLALLVGIDRYSYSKNLSGCVTDVELQRELLVQRFGFHPSDVLVLTDQQATRENIEIAFIEHLTEQAKEGDIVVFHFSGYGNCVKRVRESAVPDDAPERLVKSLLPSDGLLSTKGEPANNDLLLETLILLTQSLAAQQVALVLDTSFYRTDRLLQGTLRSRSPLIPVAERPNPQELAFQEQLKSLLKLTHKPIGETIPGVMLFAATDRQIAVEAQWEGFSAGLFTYAIAQHLWQVTPASPLYITLARADEQMGRLAPQRPDLASGSSLKPTLLTYFVPPQKSMGAEGVAIAIEENGTAVRLQLAGLPPTVLEYYQPNSRLLLSLERARENASSAATDEAATVQLQIRSRSGLTAQAKVVSEVLPEGVPLQVGLLARELIRVLPHNLGLTVALATDLERIERVDATSAFSNIAAVSSVAIAGEQAADCLFGRGRKSTALPVLPEEAIANSTPEVSPRGYELFSRGNIPIPNTAGSPDEAIKSGVQRLIPKLETLLAAKLWRLTLNEGSSRLGVRATLATLDPHPQILIDRAALRSGRIPQLDAPPPLGDLAVSNSWLPAIAPRSRIQYTIENYSDRALYLMLLGLEADGNAIALYPAASEDNSSNLQPTIVEPGAKLTLPHSNARDWTISEAPGLAEIYLICSLAPFAKTLQAISAFPYPQFAGERLQVVRNPLEVAEALLQDLHDASAVAPELMGSATDVYAFDVNAWATFSFVYRVVESRAQL
jgi:Caspase domain/Domain of unknown function (DUF4384)